jgi:hypothetical protein
MSSLTDIRDRFNLLSPAPDERGRRLLAATEAKLLGYSGVSALSRITGLCRHSIPAGIEELTFGDMLPAGRVRRSGGERKRKCDSIVSLMDDLEAMVELDTRGDPESPLRWTVKSLRQLTVALRELGHDVSRRIVSGILHDLNYSLQGNQKRLEGKDLPDCDKQFRHMNKQVRTCKEIMSTLGRAVCCYAGSVLAFEQIPIQSLKRVQGLWDGNNRKPYALGYSAAFFPQKCKLNLFTLFLLFRKA